MIPERIPWYEEALERARNRGNEALVIVVPISSALLGENNIDRKELQEVASEVLMEWLIEQLGVGKFEATKKERNEK